MLEVGNGSGKYSYANAENKYYSAFDLGWHVAPTYGEDNHDATWGQTKKRTVIVAKDLTQDSLLGCNEKYARIYDVKIRTSIGCFSKWLLHGFNC